MLVSLTRRIVRDGNLPRHRTDKDVHRAAVVPAHEPTAYRRFVGCNQPKVEGTRGSCRRCCSEPRPPTLIRGRKEERCADQGQSRAAPGVGQNWSKSTFCSISSRTGPAFRG